MQEPLELPRAGWIPLAAAAQRLGVTPWEARRWVRQGRLHAEMRRGPDGSHYYVPALLVNDLALALAVAEPGTEGGRIAANDGRLEADDATLVQALVQLRAEVQQAVEFHEASETALREELSQIRIELAAGIAALRMAQVSAEEPARAASRPWWRFWLRTWTFRRS